MSIDNIQNISFTARIKYQPIPYADLVRLICGGYTYTQIGEMYNVPYHVVVRLVKSYDIKTHKMANKLARLNNGKTQSKTEYLRKLSEFESDRILQSLIKKLNLNRKEINKSVKFDVDI